MSSGLGEALGLGEVADDELYAALDWLLARQAAIDTTLAPQIDKLKQRFSASAM